MNLTTDWAIDPDRALPADPAVRPLAREIFSAVEPLPIVSMHGHVDVDVFVQNRHFANPTELLIIPDHYLVRMMVSQGFTNAELGVPSLDGSAVEQDPRTIWRRFCQNWKLFRGTPTRLWLEHELAVVFGVNAQPSAENADALYDSLAESLQTKDFLPRAILERFKVEILATTDSATSTLDGHRQLRKELGENRIVPTFRPDSLFHITNSKWQLEIDHLGALANRDIDSYPTFIAALEQRRQAFIAAGGRATDHGHLIADTTPLSAFEAQRIFTAGLAGTATSAEAAAFSANMLYEMARMSTEDGLVMQLHPGVLRNHHAGTHGLHGPDTGFDIPVKVEFTRALQPMLDAFGMNRDFRFIAFTTDETVYSRELAPLAGVYPAMRLGAPWWFLDSPEQMRRFRESAVETAGFYNTSGFVDDTRALASIPARHDLSRRMDAGFLARLVAEGRLGMDEAIETAIDLTYNLPNESYAPREQVEKVLPS